MFFAFVLHHDFQRFYHDFQRFFMPSLLRTILFRLILVEDQLKQF